MYKKQIQDRTETVLLLPKTLADKSLPQHFLGFSVRTNQDRGVATRILFSSNVTSKYKLLLVCKYVPFSLAWYLRNAWREFHYIWQKAHFDSTMDRLEFGGQKYKTSPRPYF